MSDFSIPFVLTLRYNFEDEITQGDRGGQNRIERMNDLFLIRIVHPFDTIARKLAITQGERVF